MVVSERIYPIGTNFFELPKAQGVQPLRLEVGAYLLDERLAPPFVPATGAAGGDEELSSALSGTKR